MRSGSSPYPGAMRTPMRWTAVSLAGVLFLAGCSGGGADTASDNRDAAGIANDSAAEAPAAAGAEDGVDATGSGAPGLNLAASDREVITSGSVTMTVDDPEAVAADLSRVVENLGGWVENLTQQAATENTDASARMVVRIPSQDVTSTLERLADYGTVDDVNLARTDVTMAVRDLEARIRALNLSIERMEDLLARATTTTDLVNAEQMLTDRQSELESLLSQQALLADQVSMSTLDIQMWTVESAPEPEPEPATGFWAGLVNGWNSFYDTGSSTLMVIGAMLPWLVFFALLALVVVVIRRPLKRRQAAKALSAASQGPVGQGPTTALPPMGAPAPYGYPAPVGQPWQGQPAPVRPAPPQPPPAQPVAPAAPPAPPAAPAPQTTEKPGEQPPPA